MLSFLCTFALASADPVVLGFDKYEKIFAVWDGAFVRAVATHADDDDAQRSVSFWESKKVRGPEEVAADFTPGEELYKSGTKTSAKFEGGEVRIETVGDHEQYATIVVKQDDMVRSLAAMPFGFNYNLTSIRKSKGGALAVIYKRSQKEGGEERRLLSAVAMSWADYGQIAEIRTLTQTPDGTWQPASGWQHDGSEKTEHPIKIQVAVAKTVAETVKASLTVKVLGSKRDGKQVTIATKTFALKHLKAGITWFELVTTWDPAVSSCDFRIEASTKGDVEWTAKRDDLVTCGT